MDGGDVQTRPPAVGYHELMSSTALPRLVCPAGSQQLPRQQRFHNGHHDSCTLSSTARRPAPHRRCNQQVVSLPVYIGAVTSRISALLPIDAQSRVPRGNVLRKPLNDASSPATGSVLTADLQITDAMQRRIRKLRRRNMRKQQQALIGSEDLSREALVVAEFEHFESIRQRLRRSHDRALRRESMRKEKLMRANLRRTSSLSVPPPAGRIELLNMLEQMQREEIISQCENESSQLAAAREDAPS